VRRARRQYADSHSRAVSSSAIVRRKRTRAGVMEGLVVPQRGAQDLSSLTSSRRCRGEPVQPGLRPIPAYL
jgi:hypothetical protein